MRYPKYLIPFICLFFTGCSTETISDRMYTQAIGLTCSGKLSFYAQAFEQPPCAPVEGISITEVLRQEEAANGGKVFIGHTELLCLDGTCTLNPAEELLFQKGLSPACKVLYTRPGDYFQNPDSKAVIHTIRMSEQNGLLSPTELSTALSEWHGVWETALLPVLKPDQSTPGLVLLHKDGTCQELSSLAAEGMYWLRRNSGSFSMTLQTPDGEKDILIRRSRVEKHFENQTFSCHVLIYADNPELKNTLRRRAEKQCEAALTEMLAANADVIGIQEILENAHIKPEKNMSLKFEISVSVQ